MKSLLLLSILFSLNVFASVESDSDALSQSFNTTPLGRANSGFRVVKFVEASTFEEDQKALFLACKKDSNLCPKESAPVQKKTVKKNIIDKALDLTEK